MTIALEKKFDKSAHICAYLLRSNCTEGISFFQKIKTEALVWVQIVEFCGLKSQRMRFLYPLGLFFCFLNVAPLAAQVSEEAAIRQMIEAETHAFTLESVADVARKYWVLDEKTLKIVSVPQDGIVIISNAEDILSETEVPPPSHATVEKTDFIFQINGHAAVVHNNQKVFIAETNQTRHTREVRLLQKVDGQWKIHLMTIHTRASE
jgi:hypothetical protein